MSKKIDLKGDFIQKEAEASSAIMPGHLVRFGGVNELEVHGTAGVNARKAFALDNDLIGRDLDTAYAAGETVRYGVFPPGAEVNALVAAAAPAIAKGDALQSAGDGTLRKAVTSAATADTARDSVVAYAMEAVDNSAGGTAVRIVAEVA